MTLVNSGLYVALMAFLVHIGGIVPAFAAEIGQYSAFVIDWLQIAFTRISQVPIAVNGYARQKQTTAQQPPISDPQHYKSHLIEF